MNYNNSSSKKYVTVFDSFLPVGVIENIDEKKSQPNLIKLSKRHDEILKYLILGKTAKQIAQILNLSHRTIEFYLTIIKRKFKAVNKSDLIEKVIVNYIESFIFLNM